MDLDGNGTYETYCRTYGADASYYIANADASENGCTSGGCTYGAGNWIILVHWDDENYKPLGYYRYQSETGENCHDNGEGGVVCDRYWCTPISTQSYYRDRNIVKEFWWWGGWACDGCIGAPGNGPNTLINNHYPNPGAPICTVNNPTNDFIVRTASGRFVSGDARIDWVFEKRGYTLTVTKSGTGTGTVTSLDGKINCGPDCQRTSATYNPGSGVTLTATADQNSYFAGWSGDCTPDTNDPKKSSVTMDSNKTCNAKFQLKYTASGVVLNDLGNNFCQSGAAGYGEATLLLEKLVDPPTGSSRTTDANGNYSFQNSLEPSILYQLGLDTPTDYRIVASRINGGAWDTQNTNNPYTFTATGDITLDYCINQNMPWFQTTTGDVRYPKMVDKVPTGNYASLDSSNPSLFYSSDLNADFGRGWASPLGQYVYTADYEYDYNNRFERAIGIVNSSFYEGMSLYYGKPIQDYTCFGNCDVDVTSPFGEFFEAGKGKIVRVKTTGEAQIRASSDPPPNSRLILLVEKDGSGGGNARIVSDIKTPQNSVFILAVEGDLTIDKDVGVSSPSDSTTINLSGIFAADGSIVLDGTHCDLLTNPDKRLNVQGNLFANANYPFARPISGLGGGELKNKRSLCPTTDAYYPTLFITPNWATVFNITDFYKEPTYKWQEVEP